MSYPTASTTSLTTSGRSLRRLCGLAALMACLTLGGCSGGGTSGTSGAGKGDAADKARAKLVGVWEGTWNERNLKFRFDFKESGRYSYTVDRGLDSGIGTGNWKVSGSDGNLIAVQLVADLHPNEVEGLKFTMKGDDEVFLEYIWTATLKRQR
jgi:hypothetical protein